VRYEGVFGGTAGEHASRMTTGIAAGKSSFLAAAREAPPASPTPPPAPDVRTPSPGNRTRLAADLLALLDHGPGTPGAAACNGAWVPVEVELADESPRAVRRLEDAGLVIDSARGRRVRGVVALDHLAALADQPAVVHIAGRPVRRSS
jgi:hypothetical protein